METGLSVVAALRWLDLAGVLANAVVGGVIARAARLDLIGFATLATLSGLGGGIIRDTLLQRGTPVALTDPAYALVAIGGSVIAFLITVEGPVWDRIWTLIDALALGCWAAAGAQKTLAYGLGWLPAVLLGSITAVGGGFIRDVVLLRIPGVLGGNTLYATCALIASGVMVGFYRADHPTIGAVVATLVGGVLCLVARWQNWRLPHGGPDRTVSAFIRRYRQRPDGD